MEWRQALFPPALRAAKLRAEGTGTGAGNREPGRNAGRKPRRNRDGHRRQFGEPVRAIAGRNASETRLQRFKDQGRVVIEIMVDQQGKVTAATYRSKGSTTQNSSLVNSALQAAAAQFNVDENAPVFTVREPSPTISGCSDVVLRRTEHSRNSA